MRDRLTKYKLIRGRMKTGDLLQWQSNSVLGWVIRLLSHGKVNHSGLIFRFQEYAGLSNNRWTMEALENGFDLNLLSDRLKSFDGMVWWYPLKDEYNECRDDIATWAMLHKGIKYDFLGIVKQIIGRVSANARRLFCSEACYLAYKSAEIPMNWKGKKSPQPADMPGLGIFKKPINIL